MFSLTVLLNGLIPMGMALAIMLMFSHLIRKQNTMRTATAFLIQPICSLEILVWIRSLTSVGELVLSSSVLVGLFCSYKDALGRF